MINALQGTRMGRKVKSVEEVMGEAQEWAKQGRGLEASVGPEPLRAKFPCTSEDIFSYSSLTEPAVGLWELKDLEVPEGTWSKIALQTYNAESNSRPTAEARDWIAYSDGRLTFDQTGKTTIKGNPFNRKEHLATAKSLYWFLRAEFEKQGGVADRSGPSIQQTIYHMGLGLPLILSDRVMQLDGFNTIRNRTPYILSIPHGWPDPHPLLVRSELDYPFCDVSRYHTHTKLNDVITTLFGDLDIIRIGKVFNWVFGSDARFSIEHLSKDQGYNFCLDSDQKEVRLNQPSERGYAAHIIADPNDFKPRVRK